MTNKRLLSVILHIFSMTHTYVLWLMAHPYMYRDWFICAVTGEEVAPVLGQHTATHCNTLQHTATHCNTLQHTATHCGTSARAPHCTRHVLFLCAMTHSYIFHDSWLTHRHDSCIFATTQGASVRVSWRDSCIRAVTGEEVALALGHYITHSYITHSYIQWLMNIFFMTNKRLLSIIFCISE